jgi:hypothetical protein
MGEFDPVVLDNLRQPLEEGVIRVARPASSMRCAVPASWSILLCAGHVRLTRVSTFGAWHGEVYLRVQAPGCSCTAGATYVIGSHRWVTLTKEPQVRRPR